MVEAGSEQETVATEPPGRPHESKKVLTQHNKNNAAF
jgi:hypothetical protein